MFGELKSMLQPATPQPQSGMSQSRFFMWRAIIALAHAHGILTQKERDFVEGYIKHLPLSDQQKAIMQEDIDTPQSINGMLMGVQEENDHADFFQFAQMIMWCNGNQDEQEKAIVDRLTAEQ